MPPSPCSVAYPFSHLSPSTEVKISKDFAYADSQIICNPVKIKFSCVFISNHCSSLQLDPQREDLSSSIALDGLNLSSCEEDSCNSPLIFLRWIFFCFTTPNNT
ncbi:hypothetical protein N5A56_006745 [Polaribacter sp. MSW5]|uniref:Uncharacterized protein n=1 Tax=Polaribacter ponticola TaxID=2978475 RepID=A0ABT5S7R3_9FLAO|nr:hypothetical protein [Polaribacter sp. MSW5]MDD7914139.1 hypothetical protein [Polaribacter sp. MSW5]